MHTPLSFPIAVFFVLILILSIPAAADDRENADHAIVQLADGVYGWVWTDPLQDPVEGNALFIINDEDVLVVDTGLFPSTARRMISELRELTAKPVRYVVNTHWHDDHHGGNGVYLEEFPAAELIAHPHTRTDIIEQSYAPRPDVLASYASQIETIERWVAQGHDDDGKPFDDARRERAAKLIALLERVIDELENVPLAPPTLLVENRLVLDRGERKIEVLWVGKGNTRGDLVVYLPKEKIVATGDLLVYPVPFGIGSNYREWIETLDEVSSLDADILFPGHGPVFRDREYLQTVRSLLVDLVGQVDDAVEEGLDLEETQKRVTLAEWEERLAGDDPVRARSFDAFFVAPAVKRAWELANGVAAEAEGLYGN